MFSKFTENAQKILLMTKQEMQALNHPYVGSEHLLLAILKNNKSDTSMFLRSYGVTYENFRDEIIKVIGVGKNRSDWFLYTPLLKRIIENAIENVGDNAFVDTIDLFEALLDEGEGVANRILMGMNIDVDALYEKFTSKYSIRSKGNKPLFIEEYGVNMNKEYNLKGFDPVLGRDKQVLRVVEILLRRTKNNPLLLGDAGVGKTAIVEELVRRIEEGDVPSKLRNVKIMSLSMSNLVAGTKYRGEFEDRMNQIISELENIDDIIVFIDEIHTLVGAGGAEGAIDASNILKPYLARGKLKVIGATTKDEYKKYIEKEKALDRRFQKVYIEEMSANDTKAVLFTMKPLYEEYHGVTITEQNVDTIVNLCDKFVVHGRFPDKALDILDEVCARTAIAEDKCDVKKRELLFSLKSLKSEKNKAIIENDFLLASDLKNQINGLEDKYNKLFLYDNVKSKKNVSDDFIYNVFYDKTKIPVSFLKNINKEQVILELSKHVIGRENIIRSIIESSIKPLFVKKTRPSVYLFVGKSGLGKTFLAKEYAKLLFGDKSFVKLDMSEFKDDFSSTKILGSPPGYVGYRESNILLDKIKEYPYSVLLLDEIEKAHPNILKLFLQVFDDGFMTSSDGEKIDFSNVVVFMTSNLGMNNDKIGFSSNNNLVIQMFRDFLGNEFVNRINEVFLFEPFNKSDVKTIIRKKLTDYVEKNNLNIKISADIVNNIFKDCDYLVSGVRKIDDLIEKYFIDVDCLAI